VAIHEIEGPEGFYRTESGLYIPDHLVNPERQNNPNPFNVAINIVDFADPNTLIHNGEIYAFGTHTDGVNQPDYILAARVVGNLLNWEVIQGDAIVKHAKYANGYYKWAPHVRYNPYTDLFNMYYAVSINKKSMGISMAESMYPDHGFIDYSKAPIVGAYPLNVDRHQVNRVIDPDVYVREDEQPMLVYGSAGIPLYEQPLTPDGKNVIPKSVPRAILKPINRMYERRIEAGTVKYVAGKKFLIYAGDDCFGNGYRRYGDYAVMQSRYNYETGYFERRSSLEPNGNNVLLEGNFDWKNPGHQDLFVLIGPNGEELIFLITSVIDRSDPYHPNSRKNKRATVISRVLEKDGWLYVPGGKYDRSSVPYFR
jgi:hypothetical protein